MSDITLRVDKIQNGKVYLTQTNNGTIKLVGSSRSPFLRDFKLAKDSVVKVSLKMLTKTSRNRVKVKKKVSKKRPKTAKKKRR